MKRIIVAFLLILNIGIAYGASDKTITSKTYVDNQLATKQDKIRAIDDKTVITHTGSASEIGEKGIYDSNGDFVSQYSSLVTAGDANTGINNALENEFVCVEFDTDGTCLLWNIKNTSPQQILPDGYTALEYLEGNARPYIDTLISGNTNDLRIVVKFNVRSFSGRAYQGTYYDGVIGNYASESTNMWRILLAANQENCTVSDGACNLRMSYYANAIPNSGVRYGYVVVELNQDYIVDFSQTRAFINGQHVIPLSTGNSQGSAGTGSIKLFAGGANGRINYYSHTRIYYFLLYNGDNLVRNMIPARRNSDNVLGMYDTVTNTFFTNSGSGTFIAGPTLNVYIPSGN